ncbi:MAG: hypothetical protein M1828_002728 [Chrysothrix sp. TS-e1954]|nr:MAG: hypothetical protein M1828_002728 [Chrysothrix sp. TS-e1954]
MASERAAFPQLPEDFEADPRVSYSKLDNKWILEEEDGSEWEFEESRNKWVPSLDEAALEQQRQAYNVQGVDPDEPVNAAKKRKADDQEDGSSKKQKPAPKQNPPRKNTAVYVTSLPLDATADEIHTVFSKYGLVAEEVESGEPRIKLYKDDSGNPKGEALVVYFRPESVQLAIDMLDDSDFRFTPGGKTGKMRVLEADSSFKKNTEKTEMPKGRKTVDQKKVIARKEKLNSKLADWDDDDPQAMPATTPKDAKVVILKYMFTAQEIEEDPAAAGEIEEDIRDECSKLGQVQNVTLFDKEPEGVASVRFNSAQSAMDCVQKMNGRNFDQRVIEATIATGEEKFKKTRKQENHKAEDQLNDEERLKKFGQELESGGLDKP